MRDFVGHGIWRKFHDAPQVKHYGKRGTGERLRAGLAERAAAHGLGFRQTGIPYERRPREAGVSKAPVWDLLLFVSNAVTSFSLKPLRLFTLLGFVLVALSLIGSCAYSLLFLIGSPPPGITTLIVLSCLGIGINSLGIGVLGEYVGRTYAEAKARPLLLPPASSLCVTQRCSSAVSAEAPDYAGGNAPVVLPGDAAGRGRRTWP